MLLGCFALFKIAGTLNVLIVIEGPIKAEVEERVVFKGPN